MFSHDLSTTGAAGCVRSRKPGQRQRFLLGYSPSAGVRWGHGTMSEPPSREDTLLLPGAVEVPAPAQPTSPLGGRLPADALGDGVQIGEYRIEKLLGEGGMGQ